MGNTGVCRVAPANRLTHSGHWQLKGLVVWALFWCLRGRMLGDKQQQPAGLARNRSCQGAGCVWGCSHDGLVWPCPLGVYSRDKDRGYHLEGKRKTGQWARNKICRQHFAQRPDVRVVYRAELISKRADFFKFIKRSFHETVKRCVQILQGSAQLLNLHGKFVDGGTSSSQGVVRFGVHVMVDLGFWAGFLEGGVKSVN